MIRGRQRPGWRSTVRLASWTDGLGPRHAVLGAVAAVLAYTSWVWAGIRPSFHEPGFWVGVVLLVLVPMAGWLSKDPVQLADSTMKSWLRDPVLWSGAVLIGLLCLQFWNAGRPLAFDSSVAAWVAMPPRHPGWPFAHDPAEARQMITWFLPAWALALAARRGGLRREDLRRLLVFIALNAAALSAFGILQRVSGTTSMYGTTALPGRFFASFGYENHAASFFLLTSLLSAGLLFDEMAQDPGRPRRTWVRVLGAAVGLNLIGVLLSYSRAGILLAAASVVVATGYALVWSRRWLVPADRVKLVTLLVGLATGGWVCAGLLADSDLAREIKSVTAPVPVSPAPDAPLSRIPVLLDRVHLVRSAFLMWRSSPWFGIGGEGFRHEYAAHVPREYDLYLARPGKANVHNDGVQFLAEFGVVGAGAMALAVGTMAVPVLRRRLRHIPIAFLSIVGLAGVLLHGMVDLPFRCPAILFTWTTVLAALSAMVGNAGARKTGRPRGAEAGSEDRMIAAQAPVDPRSIA